MADHQHSLFCETIEEQFEKFLIANPHVYREFVARALKLRRAGWKHYGAKAIVEVIRYDHNVKTESRDPFKVNNNFTCLLARKAMAEYSELADFFETRERKVA